MNEILPGHISEAQLRDLTCVLRTIYFAMRTGGARGMRTSSAFEDNFPDLGTGATGSEDEYNIRLSISAS